MDALNYFLILIAGINLMLALLILWRSRKLANVIYAFAIIAVIAWVGGMILFRAADISSVLFWCKILYVASTFTASTFLFFTDIFPSGKLQLSRFLVIFLPNLFLCYLILFTDKIITDVTIRNVGENVIQFGSLYLIFSSYISLYFFLGFINLVRKYRHSEGIIKSQVKYIFLGYFIASNLAMITNMVLPYMGNYSLNWLGQYFSLIMVGFTTYAIVRYRLLNIKLVITRSLIYLFLVLLISIVFVLASSVTAAFFERLGVNQYLVWVVFAILVVAGLDPLKNLFASVTDRIFYKDKIDYNAVLKSLSNLINEEIQLDSLVEHVEDDLVKELKVQDSQLLLGVYGEQIFLPLTDYLAFTPAKRSKNRVAADKHVYYNSALIQYMRKVKMPIVTDEFERYIYDLDEPTKQKKLTKILHDMQSLKAGTTVPIIREGKMVALLLVGAKVSGETFSNDDINLLEVLSSQLAAAIERSKLYQEVQDFNVKLQKEVEKATKNLQRANEQLKEANVHLKELDSAKSEFMSIASHQLRTPLAGIVGYLSMILEGDYGKIDDSQQKIVSEVFAASQRLVRLVNTFLNVTRIEAGRFTLAFSEVNFVDLVRGEVMELQPTADKKNVKLVYEEPKDKNITAMVDDKIKDAVLNLIDNAIKYTPEGTVTVKLKKEDKDTLLFSVKDSGVGISKGEAGNLFQKFVRGSGIAKVQPNGSGLGLYIVKKIVEGHGGKVWAESEGEGKGSTFNIRIPIKQKKSEYRAKAEQIFTGRTEA